MSHFISKGSIKTEKQSPKYCFLHTKANYTKNFPNIKLTLLCFIVTVDLQESMIATRSPFFLSHMP